MTVKNKEKRDIRRLSSEETVAVLASFGEKAFRAKQIDHWLWKKSVGSFGAMNNLPKTLLDKLEAEYCINPIAVAHRQDSQDGTIKAAFRLHDGHLVEGVLIPSSTRLTACISSQVGCSMTCAFCATAQLKRECNIDAAEIYDQVVALTRMAQEEHGKGLSNIVYMGMGEPLDNLKEVVKSVKIFSEEDGMAIATHRQTISTSGLSSKIVKLGKEELGVNLAISLHAVDDELRETLMPINKAYNIQSIIDAVKNFPVNDRKRVMFEYLVIKDVNDDISAAKKLLSLLDGIKSKVNLIYFNPYGGTEFKRPSEADMKEFQAYLTSRGLHCTIRESKGLDISAACGQLREQEVTGEV